MRQELEDKLREIAPQFLVEMDLDAMESCMAWGIECGDGWYMPLKRFCEAVEAMNNASPDKVIVAKQIKAKFGEMTVYWGLEEKGKSLLEREGTHDEQMEYLMRGALLSLMSECRETCELCGSTEDISEERWIYICEKCKEKGKRRINMGAEYHNEVDRLYKGKRYIVRLRDWGYRCGYVQVSEEEFKHVEKVELTCHGGITFAEEVSGENNIHLPSGHWLGFDCNHSGDGADEEAVTKLIRNTKYLPEHKQADNLAVTSEEVERDCKSLIDQILKEEEKHV